MATWWGVGLPAVTTADLFYKLLPDLEAFYIFHILGILNCALKLEGELFTQLKELAY